MSQAFLLLEPTTSELSIQEAFALALLDDTFHDVTLKGIDGVFVPANRTILGLRSPVFRKMLFGNFQEATKDIVEVDYPGAVVKAVVEYIHTDKAELLLEVNEAEGNEARIPEGCKVKFQMLLALSAAAAYYGLPKLCHDVQKCLSSHLKAFSFLVFALLEACSQEGPAISNDLKHSALTRIPKLLLEEDFDAEFLANVSPSAVELILVECKDLLSEQQCFLLIDLWCQAGSTDQDRIFAAKKLVREHVDLQLIDPEDLSTSVTSSGLVTLEQLAEAYQQQAIRAKQNFKASFARQPKIFTCTNPIWSRADCETFAGRRIEWTNDNLKCPALVTGRRYTWTVNITHGRSVWLGVALFTGHDIAESGFAGSLRGCYGFCNGAAYSDDFFPVRLGGVSIVKHGDRVTMTLDLSSENNANGTLSVSLNGQTTIRILADMCAKLPEGDDQGFVPAVSCCHNSQVMIESIEECCFTDKSRI